MRFALRTIAICLLLSTAPAWAEPRLRPMRVGVVNSLTGDAATDGENIRRGLELAAFELEDENVIVQFETENDHTSAKESLTAMSGIVARRPDAVIGPIWSFLVDSAGTAIKTGGVPTFIPSCTSEFVSLRAPNLFFGTAKNSLKREPAAKWLREHAVKRVAILTSDDAWGASNEAPFRAAAADAGAEIVYASRFQFQIDEAGASTIVLRAVSAKPDAILWEGYDQLAVALIRNLHVLRASIPILGTEELARIVAEKMVRLQDGDEVYTLALHSSEEFSEKFQRRFREPPRSYGEDAYRGMLALGRAFIKSQASKADLGATFRDSGLAGLKFDENGDVPLGGWRLERVTPPGTE